MPKSKIKNIKLNATLIDIDFNAKDFVPAQVLLPRIQIQLEGVVDGVFLEKLVKFIEEETAI